MSSKTLEDISKQKFISDETVARIQAVSEHPFITGSDDEKQHYQEVVEKLIAENAEKTEEFNQKLNSYIYVIQKKEAEALIYKERKQALEAQQKRLENEAEYMRSVLDFYVKKHGLATASNETEDGKKYDTGYYKIGIRKDTSVVIQNNPKLDDEYMRFPPAEYDKTKIKKALDEGKQLEGCILFTKEKITIK